MKLKTLKDIETKRPKGIELPYLDFYKIKLKEEAIKWVKFMDEEMVRQDSVSPREAGNYNVYPNSSNTTAEKGIESCGSVPV